MTSPGAYFSGNVVPGALRLVNILAAQADQSKTLTYGGP